MPPILPLHDATLIPGKQKGQHFKVANLDKTKSIAN
jgi:hypothetical protein